jgi:MFS family permease
VYTFTSLGFLIGPVLTGLIFDRFSGELQMFVGCLLMGMFACFATFTTSLYWFYAIMFLMYVAVGYIDSCGDLLQIKIWSCHRYQNPVVQAYFSMYSVGTFIGPLIVKPFLVPLPYATNSTYECNQTMHNNLSHLNSYKLNQTCSNDTNNSSDITIFWNTYIILGSAMCAVSTLFLISFFLLRKAEKSDSNSTLKKATSTSKYKSRIVFFMFLASQGLIVFFLQYTVIVPGGLLSTYVIKGLLWDVQYGPTASAIFSGAQAIGRILSIPISAFIKTEWLLSINITLATVGFTIMSFVTSSRNIVL